MFYAIRKLTNCHTQGLAFTFVLEESRDRARTSADFWLRIAEKNGAGATGLEINVYRRTRNNLGFRQTHPRGGGIGAGQYRATSPPGKRVD
ncbi:hypothetical protein GCM10023339_81210 [Alloalcanivorax gelatiniphagus]